MCACAPHSLTHIHTDPSSRPYVVCQEGNIKDTLAVGMRSLETSEGLWSEARPAETEWSWSVENEVGLEIQSTGSKVDGGMGQ